MPDEAETSPLQGAQLRTAASVVVMALQRSKKKLLLGFAVIGFVIMLTQIAGYKSMTR